MGRITLKQFRKMTADLPDDAIICMQSDSEGNTLSTCLDLYTEKVGHKYVNDPSVDYDYYIGAEDVYGIDRNKDKGKTAIILTPSL